MAEAPTLSNTSGKDATIAWLRSSIHGSRYNGIASALDNNNDFEGVPDLLPMIWDDSIENLRLLLKELVNDVATLITLKLVARLKQAMRKALEIEESAAPTAATTVKPDIEEVTGKLQRVGEAEVVAGGTVQPRRQRPLAGVDKRQAGRERKGVVDDLAGVAEERV